MAKKVTKAPAAPKAPKSSVKASSPKKAKAKC